MNFRSILKAGEVSRPVALSPPRKVFTNPLPRYPETSICPPSLPCAGPLPKAAPLAFHAP